MTDETRKVVRLAGAIAVLYAARRFYRNWGTTKEESQMYLAGDELVHKPVVRTTQAVWIDAPVKSVWPWLVQMGQDRGGLYSYEALENLAGLDYHNADCIHAEWQHLAVGDLMRLAPRGWMGLRDGVSLRVEEVVEQQSIVLRAIHTNQSAESVWSFHVFPHWDDRCRLLVRTSTEVRRPGQVLLTELAAPVHAMMSRGMLRGIKRRAQQQLQAETAASKASGDLHRFVQSS